MSDIKSRKILEGIRKRDHKILSDVYKRYYPLVLAYIIRNSGSESDAKDVFQESIMVVYKQVDDKDFTIREDFGAYLIGISKRIWLKQIRRVSVHERYIGQSEQETIEHHPADVEIENELELGLIRKHIVNLGEECKKVLMWSADGIKNAKIAEKLGYKSEKVVRTKKYKCKEYLINLIKQDPDFKGRAL